jgi:hypothetical protein
MDGHATTLHGAIIDIYGSETGLPGSYFFLKQATILIGTTGKWDTSTMANFNDVRYIYIKLIYGGTRNAKN